MNRIEGLKFEISYTELRSHIQSRGEYHKEQAKFYHTQAGSLREGGLQQIQFVSNDPVSSLENSEKTHMERAAFFFFMAEHLVPDSVYILSEQDLTRIELISKYF